MLLPPNLKVVLRSLATLGIATSVDVDDFPYRIFVWFRTGIGNMLVQSVRFYCNRITSIIWAFQTQFSFVNAPTHLLNESTRNRACDLEICFFPYDILTILKLNTIFSRIFNWWKYWFFLLYFIIKQLIELKISNPFQRIISWNEMWRFVIKTVSICKPCLNRH